MRLIKVILKLKCLVYQNTYILFHIFFILVEPFRLKQIQKVYYEKNLPYLSPVGTIFLLFMIQGLFTEVFTKRSHPGTL